MKERIKSNRGITTGDIVIAIIIVIIFVSIITTTFYNYYISTQGKTRNTMASNIVIDVIESVEAMEYETVNQLAVDQVIQGFIDDGTIPSGYEVSFTLTNYNETENNTDKLDLIKILKVRVQYLLNEKEEIYEVTSLITNG